MSYVAPYTEFRFESYGFDPKTSTATFRYSFDDALHFMESVQFNEAAESWNGPALDEALKLAFILTGISYYKCFPTQKVSLNSLSLSLSQADFFNEVYRHGLSQFIYENELKLSDIATFPAQETSERQASEGDLDESLLVLQSGGKDSLLLASLLQSKARTFTPWYMTSGATHPSVLDQLGSNELRSITRHLDRSNLAKAKELGALNGHVPVTYITLAFAVIDAVLHNESTVLVSIGREGAEAHAHYEGLAINHQWSKTWEAEELFSQYISRHVSPSLRVGSPLRGLSELRVAELFVKYAWQRYGHAFSSCNIGNYKQGADTTHLGWCGECPKCANSFLLFAPFVEPNELKSLFGGQNLFEKPSLLQDFKGLLGIEGVMKPFECVGETAELQAAYHMARSRYGADNYNLPFDVPVSDFDYLERSEAQPWAEALIVDKLNV